MNTCPNCNGKLIFKKKTEVIKNKEIKIEGHFCKNCGEEHVHEKEIKKYNHKLEKAS
jgi:YgiT-type zinc finger domain-containing protein